MKTVDYLEQVLKAKRKRSLRDDHILVLIALARAGRVMRLVEIVEETRVSRQLVARALGDLTAEVTTHRPRRGETHVQINQEGMKMLQGFLKVEKKGA